jgi:hypothetical protein
MGGLSGFAIWSENAAGIQYRRMSAPMAVPGPTRVKSSFSSRGSTGLPPLNSVNYVGACFDWHFGAATVSLQFTRLKLLDRQEAIGNRFSPDRTAAIIVRWVA